MENEMNSSLPNKRSFCKVEAEVIRQQEAKRGSSPKSEAQDMAISIIRLRYAQIFAIFYLIKVLIQWERCNLYVSSFYCLSIRPFNSFGIWGQLNIKVDCFFVFSYSADLQKAIESENYALAAKLRDAISELEAESLAASAKALAHENANYSFRLGQRVRHKNFGMLSSL